MPGFIKRWITYVRERFEPLSHTMMIFSFFFANFVMALICNNPSYKLYRDNYDIIHLFLGVLLLWLIFFHMRLFDDMKDLDADKIVNRERPLPRGLISVTEFGFVTLFCIIFELILSLLLGYNIFMTYLIVLSFTLLMRLEFFVGGWLRPKMELYALTHTFSAALLGILVFSIVVDLPISQVPLAFILFTLGNWFIFNVFEFGRKTYGADEERDGVESYSKRLKPIGAFTLLAVNVILPLFMLSVTSKIFNIPLNMMIFFGGVVSFAVLLAGIFFIKYPTSKFAKIYRGTVSLYLLLYNLSISVIGFLFK
jgi:4-hydroxybenzoate polyprenyltransferase